MPMCYSYLCFERSKSHPVKNLKLLLKEVRLEKANSYPWIPGGGMAIEVSIEGTGKGYFFAGILNRDEVYDGLLEGCRRAGATWIDTSSVIEKSGGGSGSSGSCGGSSKDTKDTKETKDKTKDSSKDLKDAKDSTKDLKDAKDAKDK
ncbi:hypothetical protein Pmani_033586 [Petrolisthes manimaculis]|uniref:Uncharacterized protein n=1 Tax=Petrolisthes manimaculis TaxID=1843537 RepID=A0AAE1NP46_9EUCA|nr:hypothetical protein Pmani_033586 [Petrolisthes manimaculis]